MNAEGPKEVGQRSAGTEWLSARRARGRTCGLREAVTGPLAVEEACAS